MADVGGAVQVVVAGARSGTRYGRTHQPNVARFAALTDIVGTTGAVGDRAGCTDAVIVIES